MRSPPSPYRPSFVTNAVTGGVAYNQVVVRPASPATSMLINVFVNAPKKLEYDPLTFEELVDISFSIRDLRDGRFEILDETLTDEEFLARLEGDGEE